MEGAQPDHSHDVITHAARLALSSLQKGNQVKCKTPDRSQRELTIYLETPGRHDAFWWQKHRESHCQEKLFTICILWVAVLGMLCLHFCGEKFHNFLSYFCSYLGCLGELWWCGARVRPQDLTHSRQALYPVTPGHR